MDAVVPDWTTELKPHARALFEALRASGYGPHVHTVTVESGGTVFEAKAFSPTFGLAAGPLAGADLSALVEDLYAEAWAWTREGLARGLTVPLVPEVTLHADEPPGGPAPVDH